RRYPHAKLAAQRVGTVSEITAPQLREKRYKRVAQGTRIGQSGLEETYDRYLRGADGYTRVAVNAFGVRDDRRRATVKEPAQGQRLKLTLDFDLEKAGD